MSADAALKCPQTPQNVFPRYFGAKTTWHFRLPCCARYCMYVHKKRLFFLSDSYQAGAFVPAKEFFISAENKMEKNAGKKRGTNKEKKRGTEKRERKRKKGERRNGKRERKKGERRNGKEEIKKIISFIKACTRFGTLLPQKNLPPGAEASCHKKIFRPARDSLTTNKPLAQRGTLLPQKNLPPGAGSSCYKKISRPAQRLLATKKISRPDGREIFFKQQTICFRAPDYSSPLAYLLAISDIGMALI